MPEDMETEKRLREMEKAIAVMGESFKGVQETLTDIKDQIRDFLAKAQLALAIEGRVERLEADGSDMNRRLNAAFKHIEEHKQDYATLKAEHTVCMVGQKTQGTWLQNRLNKVIDWAIPLLIMGALYLYKTHG